jgi:DNA repair exonuclease SbcCD nuclease subunit
VTHPSQIRFLHIADVHLGCNQYQSRERQRDFFLALESVIERYALPLRCGEDPQVDFIVIPGDLFDNRNIQPVTLSQASYALNALKEAKIKVFASEGNHDTAQHRHRGEPNWYNYLAGEGFLIYLQEQIVDGEVVFEPWRDQDLCGGYFDLAQGVRIIGTQWYGTRADTMIERIADALAKLPPTKFTIMLFHGGLTDYVGISSGGAEYERFLILRPYVDYLALGHIHKQYERQNWIFNPGSLEITKVKDYFETHGVYRVTVDLSPEISCKAEHLNDYRRRPVIWLSLSCDLFNTPEQIEEAIRQLVETEGKTKLLQCQREYPSDLEFLAPICYLDLQGTLGFPFSEIPLSQLEPWILEQLNALLFRYHNRTTPRRLGDDLDCVLVDGRIDRDALERRVFVRLISEDTRYQQIASPLASWATALKSELLSGNFATEDHQAFTEKLGMLLCDHDLHNSSEIPSTDIVNLAHDQLYKGDGE